MKKLIMTAVLASLSVYAHAGDVEAGEKAFWTCSACHGKEAQGNPTLNAPSLAGQHGFYLERQLNNYRAGIRGKEKGDLFGSQMYPMSLTLSDDGGVENVVAYIQTLPASKPNTTIEGDATKGKALYAVCTACHGANGEGNEALNAPKLAGQHDWYLVRQLQYFKNGARGANPDDQYGAQMIGMAATLADDQAIKDVVSYISSFPAE
ncbi:MAG: c-type cytochrome [Pseudomonadota bacterium]